MQKNLEQINKGGVKTVEGKSITRFNALKHSILRETVTEYEKSDLESLYSELESALSPSNRLEEMMVENIASNYIRLIRIAKAEAELVKEAINPSVPDVNILGYKSVVKYDHIKKFELYSRYQTATENRIHRAIMIIKALQNEKR